MLQQQDISDFSLIEQILSGDDNSFTVLALRYQPKINRIIFRYTNDPFIAADLRQDIYIKTYYNLASFQRQSSFYTWFYRIAVNTVKNYLKANPKLYYRTDIDNIAAEQLTGRYRTREYSTPENQLVCSQMQTAMINAFNELPEELKSSIIMREIDGMSYDDIAKLLDIPIGTVRSRIFRARNAIDNQIKPYL